MHFSERNVLGVRDLGKTRRLHEKHLETMPKLIGGKRGNAHEEEDTVKDRDRNHLEEAKSKNACQNQSVNQQMRKPRLNDLVNATLIVLVRHSLDVNDRRDGRRYEPREADDTVDSDHKSNDKGIIVVGLAMLERERLINQAEKRMIEECT